MHRRTRIKDSDQPVIVTHTLSVFFRIDYYLAYVLASPASGVAWILWPGGPGPGAVTVTVPVPVAGDPPAEAAIGPPGPGPATGMDEPQHAGQPNKVAAPGPKQLRLEATRTVTAAFRPGQCDGRTPNPSHLALA